MNWTCFNRDSVLVNWIPGKTSYKSLTAFLFKTLVDIERVKPRFFMNFSLWLRGVNMNLRGSRCQILNETMKYRATRHVESQLCIPKRRRGSLQTCLILDILWYFLKFFSDFSVIKYWIPIKVLGLRFADLVLCPAFALQGLCPRFGTSQKNWWFGTWDLEDLRRSWVNFRVDKWHPMTLCMHFGWLAHGNHIRYHENGSDPTGPTANF